MRTENEIARIVVDICFMIHKTFVPGLFESLYENILCYELMKQDVPFLRQKSVRVSHDGRDMGIGFVTDLIIENKVIVELKSVENLAEIHHKQILTYLKITNLKLGLLINFNVPLIKNGIHRKVNNL